MERVDRNFLLQGIAAWVPMPFLAILNGAFREGVLIPVFGLKWALPLSGLVLVFLLYGCAWFFLSRVTPPQHCSTAWLVGLIWVGLTIAFEFALSVLWLQRPVAEFLYTFSVTSLVDGNMILAIIVLLFLAPAVCASALRRN